ncbi:MAG: MEDS domain-containing protein [Methanobacterium sp.]
MKDDLRKTGVNGISNVPWGTHFCMFYESKEDLINILVPYFKAGLENNEFCMWVTSEPLNTEEAEKALRLTLPNIDVYLEKGQLEIIPYNEWYIIEGEFDSDRVLNGWVNKLNNSQDNGFDGLRLTGNTSWLEKNDWNNFVDYEEEVDSILINYPMIAMCTYSIDKCNASEIIEVVNNHEFALVKRQGEWTQFESTKKKKMKEALNDNEHRFAEAKRIFDVLETLPTMICLLTPDYHVKFANRAFRDKFGESEGRHCYDYCFGRTEPCDFCESYEVLETGQPHQWEVKAPDGSIIEAYDFPFTDADGSPLILEMDVDVTEQRQTQNALKKINETLEEQVKERTQELSKSNIELKRSNKELEQFAYISSHDLQEPLRMVTSFTQLLERRYKGQLDNEADEYIEFIVEGAHRMKYLIDDLLTFSRLNTQAKKFENVNLETVLNEVLSNLTVSIEESNAIITHDPLPTVNADKTQMMQVFQNLIANAIKFHGSNPPKIHISAHKDEKEWKFAVTDNGIGIDPEYQKQIFEVFKRLHTREEYPGSGIGLSVSQKIIRRHGGNIWVESELGKGSTFYFTIPHSINDHPNFI